MTTETLLLILLVIAIITALPTWPYSRSWGYGPSGFLLVVCIVLVVFLLMNERGAGPSTREIGQDVKEIGQDVGQGVREAGREIKDAVKDATN